MRDRVRATISTHRDAEGRVIEQHVSATCVYCQASVGGPTHSLRIKLWLKFHKWWCRGYYFPRGDA